MLWNVTWVLIFPNSVEFQFQFLGKYSLTTLKDRCIYLDRFDDIRKLVGILLHYFSLKDT